MNGEDYFAEKLIRLQPSDSWNKESGSEDELTFVFIKGGIGTYVSQNTTQRLLAGSILFFSGRSSGKLVAEVKGDCVFTTFSLRLEHLYSLFTSNEIGMLNHAMANFKAVKVYSPNSQVALDCLPLLENVHLQSRLIQRSEFLRIVAAIWDEEFKNLRNHHGQDWAEDRMIQVFEKLTSAELLDLSADELAAKFSCSRRHLNRLFHQHFNMSITALRMEIRLLKAVSLLRNPMVKVINVAEQCGFNHLGLFNTCFKRRFGTSPGQWRKSAVTKGNAAAVQQANQINSPAESDKPFPLGIQSEAGGQSANTHVIGKIATVSGGIPIPSHWETTLGMSSVTDVRGSGSKAQSKKSA